MHSIRLSILAVCLSAGACAHAVRPATAPPPPAPDALIVLPGFGYNPAGEAAFRTLAPALAADGFDLYVPTYIGRSGLAGSRARLQQTLRDLRLQRYARVHVFAFLAGAWTLNPLVDAGSIPNLTTIVFDRSPYQERAPRVARERLPVLTWIRYGTTVFDLASTPYAPVAADVRIGLMVETMPTPFIRRFAKAAGHQGDYDFACDSFGQRHDDCIYAPLNHGELYARFADVWPEIRSFIRDGRFTVAADRTPPSPATILAAGR
jgi:hypothetical protein